MNYSLKIELLLKEQIGYEHFNPGLDNLKKVLKTWQLDSTAAKIITIAGTNGKGETTRAIGHLLSKEHSYLQWTSPHVNCINERFVHNGQKVECDVIYEIIQHYLLKLKADNFKLSYYEFLFVVFLELNKRLEPQFLLLEVGLGGRLDAVNVFDADLAVLTSIGRDHQEFLGNRLDLIILEKLAISRKSKFLISTLELLYLRQIAKNYCETNAVKWIDLIDENSQLKNLNYSNRNQLLAQRSVELITGKTITEKHWLGYHSSTMTRWEENGVEFYGFGSHNPDGLRKLVQFLSQHNYNNFDTLIFSFSKRNTKDIECMLKIINQLNIPTIKLVAFKHPKAMEESKLKTMAMAYSKVEFVDDSHKVIQNLSPNSKVLVCGSYYFLGEFQKISTSSIGQ